jgi:hypothetical protein
MCMSGLMSYGKDVAQVPHDHAFHKDRMIRAGHAHFSWPGVRSLLKGA